MAEYELLLDNAEQDYHLYGRRLHRPALDPAGAAANLLEARESSLSTSSLHGHIAQYLDAAASTSCFPRKYLEYSESVGRDLSKAVSEVDKARRIARRRRRRRLPSGPTADDTTTSAASTEDDGSEGVLRVLSPVVARLQTRQMEASLRRLLSGTLAAANTCEDLAAAWKQRLQRCAQPTLVPSSGG